MHKLEAPDGTFHVLTDFVEWKDQLNEAIALSGGPEAGRFYGSLTSTTRLAPTIDWCMATAKHNLRRSLRGSVKVPLASRRTVEDALLSKAFSAFCDSAVLDGQDGRLSVADLDLGAHLCAAMVCGEIDKEKTSGFIC